MHAPPTATPPTADASLHDMLRIMDVASALRRERETAEAVLDADTAKRKLRERLLATAAAAGEAVTPAEVDAAIDQYFREQHEYRDPPAGWGMFWAKAWVMRRTLFLVTGLLTAATLTIGLLAMAMAGAFAGPEQPVRRVPPARAPAAPATDRAPTPGPTPAADPAAELATLWAQFERTAAATAALAADQDARARTQGVRDRGAAAHAAGSLDQLRTAHDELTRLAERLGEEYTVTIVSRPGTKSGIDRYDDRGRLSGYYLIVEALTADGRALPRRIRNGETSGVETVTQWGELVSTAVWERVVADKQADGVVDDNRFAEKQRGSYEEKTILEDGGKPLRRGRQITRW